jgi:hypothetical protein
MVYCKAYRDLSCHSGAYWVACHFITIMNRNLEEKHVRFGLNELEKHGLVSGYPVLYEKNGKYF